MKEALYWKKLDDSKVQCLLCPKQCMISEGKSGSCRVRINKSGVLYSRIYGEVSSVALDPIEKKPLYHLNPGKKILSLGSIGCNFTCKFCQNWQISQEEATTERLTPEEAVKLAKDKGSFGISYTYNEPLVGFEYVLDTSKLAHKEGLKNTLVTNGFINQEPLKELLEFIDGMNIDLKSMNEKFYRELVKGELKPVLETIETSSKNCHVELTMLLIPGENDSDEEIENVTSWIAGIDKNIPLHFSRYFPQHKMSLPPTPEEKLYRAKEIADKKLNFVYLGNLHTDEGSITFCPKCKKNLIERSGYSILNNHVKNGLCKFCKEKIYGIFS